MLLWRRSVIRQLLSVASTLLRLPVAHGRPASTTATSTASSQQRQREQQSPPPSSGWRQDWDAISLPLTAVLATSLIYTLAGRHRERGFSRELAAQGQTLTALQAQQGALSGAMTDMQNKQYNDGLMSLMTVLATDEDFRNCFFGAGGLSLSPEDLRSSPPEAQGYAALLDVDAAMGRCVGASRTAGLHLKHFGAGEGFVPILKLHRAVSGASGSSGGGGGTAGPDAAPRLNSVASTLWRDLQRARNAQRSSLVAGRALLGAAMRPVSSPNIVKPAGNGGATGFRFVKAKAPRR